MRRVEKGPLFTGDAVGTASVWRYLTDVRRHLPAIAPNDTTTGSSVTQLPDGRPCRVPTSTARRKTPDRHRSAPCSPPCCCHRVTGDDYFLGIGTVNLYCQPLARPVDTVNCLAYTKSIVSRQSGAGVKLIARWGDFIRANRQWLILPPLTILP